MKLKIVFIKDQNSKENGEVSLGKDCLSILTKIQINLEYCDFYAIIMSLKTH